MDRVETIVIGAGVVGLACARALAERGQEVLVLESEDSIGVHSSSRNSEVIHAGAYYPPGSLKARLCVAGREALYGYCAAHGVAHRRTGKLIVATDTAQVGQLHSYRQRAERNGVPGLEWLDGDRISALEPAVRGVAALWVPVTGIIDSHGLLLALTGDVQRAGGEVVLRTPVCGVRPESGGFRVDAGGRDPMSLYCRHLVNAAGLAAPEMAARIEGLTPAMIPRAYFAKGHYFTLSGPSPFRHLVYPVAADGGLGIHVTLDLGGQARFGPDVVWGSGVDYGFDEGRRTAFLEAIGRYWPDLDPHRLIPGYTGVRSKIVGPDAPPADFRIDGPARHGIPGLVNLFGIESPGLTAALAIGDTVSQAL